MLAVRLLATLSVIALSLAVWLAARDLLGPGWGFLVSALVLPATALAEPILYGGYPQQFALTAGIISLWAACRYMVGGNDRFLFVVALATTVTSAAHHIYFTLIAGSIAMAALLAWVVPDVHWPRRRAAGLAVALVPAIAIFAAIAIAFVRAGYVPPLDASARSLIEGWRYATRESPALWALIFVLGVLGLALFRKCRGSPAWIMAISLIVPAGLLFLFSGQPRLLPPVLIGAGFAIGLVARHLANRDSPLPWIAPVLLLGAAILLLVPADRAVTDFARFYEVADDSLLDAAAAIETDGEAGAVAVRQDRRGWPVGWWFEALLERPILVGSDRQWLGFPDEWSKAQQGERLFDGSLGAAEFREVAGATGVRYLATRKWDWIGWERWIKTPGFPVSILYDDDEYLVLRVS